MRDMNKLQPVLTVKNKDLDNYDAWRPANSQDSSGESSKSRQGLGQILGKFSEVCSMQGPPYIYEATSWLTRILWIFFLLLAIGLMTFHLLYLCQSFFAWPVKNSISLGFSNLQFPAVTVCNVNPVRANKISELSEDFQELVKMVSPTNIQNAIIAHSGNGTNSTGSGGSPANSSEAANAQLDDIDFGLNKANFSNARKAVDAGFMNNLGGYDDSWEGEGVQSSFYQMKEDFTEIYSAENRSARITAGHQIRDMLISCSFAGKSCYPDNFTLSTSMSFGNCYTLQYDKFISRQSGPNAGLEMLFFLDRDEYIRGITPDDGLQIVVHPLKTMSFPADEGMAVAAGTYTLVSLKMIHVERKGQPYGQCSDNAAFWQKYQVDYTRETCQKFCEQRMIQDVCHCIDETRENLNVKMGVQSLAPCRSKTEVECLESTQWQYQQGGNENCGCNNPCTEHKYEKSMSFRPWPNYDYTKGILLETVCQRESSDKCTRLKQKEAGDLIKEFVKLNIFYEDLNYENLTEEADYEAVQFFSDVGGTLGLWIGLSVLGIIEVLQLFVELLRYFLCCHWSRMPKST